MEEELLFAKYACILGSFSIPLWQNNVIQFLSSHRKYRILWWEFGPTMLEYLCKKEGLNAKELKQKNENHENLEEETLRLLEAFGEVKTHWWWPWSKKIKEIKMSEKQERRAIEYCRYSFSWRLILALFTDVVVHQFRIVQYGYTYNYGQLKGGETMKKAYAMVGATVGVGIAVSSYVFGRGGVGQQNSLESAGTLVAKDRLSNLIRAIVLTYNVDADFNTTLNKTLASFELKWLLMRLDMSIKDVEEGKKSKGEHDKYFKNRIKDFKRLSLTYHPDKNIQIDINDIQKVINETSKALEGIHAYVMQDGRANEKYGHIYRLFGEIPISVINGNQEISKIVNIAACSKLYYLAYWEEGKLMQARNNYLGKVKEYIALLKNHLNLMEKMFNKEAMTKEVGNNLIQATNTIKKDFDECHENYKRDYEENWLENLKLLSEECGKSKEFEIIKPEVDKLLKEGKEQYKILNGYKSDKVKPDEVFVQPVLEYTNLVEVYYKFIIKLCEDIRSCFPTRVSGFDKEAYNRQKFIVGEGKTEFIEKSKDYIRSKLSYGELSEFLNYMINYYYHRQNKKELKEEINKYYDDKVQRKEEIGNVLIFALDHLAKLYQEEFKQKENWFEKEKRRMEEARKEMRELDARIEEAVARADEEKTRADQAETRAELERRIRKTFTREIRRLGDELGDIVENNQDEIVEAVVNYAMEHRQHPPEPIISTVMGEIKLNREQVISEGIVNAELINTGIRSFLTNVSVQPGTSHASGVNR
ncbi:hypothetical protein [Candidatus Mesenet endosymbiont of Agriotes lineatus]|uniref:hypothetical protein n=1 Tax=Candidatus Mesenet endosymbiont of Agriotes lineatus TaxID=3077948 RepID=UPI0030D4DC48